MKHARWRGCGRATGAPTDRVIVTPLGEALLVGESLERARELAQQAMSAEELTGDLFADLEKGWTCIRCARYLHRAMLVDGESCPYCSLVQ